MSRLATLHASTTPRSIIRLIFREFLCKDTTREYRRSGIRFFFFFPSSSRFFFFFFLLFFFFFYCFTSLTLPINQSSLSFVPGVQRFHRGLLFPSFLLLGPTVVRAVLPSRSRSHVLFHAPVWHLLSFYRSLACSRQRDQPATIIICTLLFLVCIIFLPSLPFLAVFFLLPHSRSSSLLCSALLIRNYFTSLPLPICCLASCASWR